MIYSYECVGYSGADNYLSVVVNKGKNLMGKIIFFENWTTAFFTFNKILKLLFLKYLMVMLLSTASI